MQRRPTGRFSRWWLVVLAAVGMGMAGTYQFAWSSVRIPLGARVGATETALGTVLTVFVVFQTTSQFPAGWVRDRLGPRPPLAVGALLLAAGYVGTALAPTTAFIYLFYALGGVGAGTVYTVTINTPVKWFDDRRGLATGIVGFAYSGASFALIPFIRGQIETDFVGTMLGLAALVGVLTLAAVPVLRDPEYGSESDGAATGDADDPDRDSAREVDRNPDENSARQVDGNPARETDRNPDGNSTPEGDRDADGDAAKTEAVAATGYSWRETVRTWQFWLLYGVFAVVNGVGLMIVGKVVAFAEAMALSAAAATGAASVVALGDGAGVVVGGALSDRFGRERTIALSLVVSGSCLAGSVWVAGDGLSTAFVGLVAAAAFFRSPVFSVFPSLVGEYYGTKRSSENYAVLYSGKLWGGIVGGTVASALSTLLGWTPTFLLGAGLLVVAGASMVFLRPVENSAG